MALALDDIALPFLRTLFGDAVLQPIRLHVDAERYLCTHGHVATEGFVNGAQYWTNLSAGSKRSLELQGRDFYRLRSTTVHFATARRGCGPRTSVGRRGEDRKRRNPSALPLPGARQNDCAAAIDCASRVARCELRNVDEHEPDLCDCLRLVCCGLHKVA